MIYEGIICYDCWKWWKMHEETSINLLNLEIKNWTTCFLVSPLRLRPWDDRIWDNFIHKSCINGYYLLKKTNLT
jgi:hypothetical protein